MKRKVKVSVAQLCLTFCDPMDCSLPNSSVHRVLHARILEWVAIPFSRGSSQPRDQTQILYLLSHHGRPRPSPVLLLSKETSHCVSGHSPGLTRASWLIQKGSCTSESAPALGSSLSSAHHLPGLLCELLRNLTWPGTQWDEHSLVLHPAPHSSTWKNLCQGSQQMFSYQTSQELLLGNILLLI